MQGQLSDRELAELLAQQKTIELKMRAVMEGTRDVCERSSAEAASRHATATRREIERWMASRMARANGVGTT